MISSSTEWRLGVFETSHVTTEISLIDLCVSMCVFFRISLVFLTSIWQYTVLWTNPFIIVCKVVLGNFQFPSIRPNIVNWLLVNILALLLERGNDFLHLSCCLVLANV